MPHLYPKAYRAHRLRLFLGRTQTMERLGVRQGVLKCFRFTLLPLITPPFLLLPPNAFLPFNFVRAPFFICSFPCHPLLLLPRIRSIKKSPHPFSFSFLLPLRWPTDQARHVGGPRGPAPRPHAAGLQQPRPLPGQCTRREPIRGGAFESSFSRAPQRHVSASSVCLFLFLLLKFSCVELPSN